jgi:hypothetical protein
MASPMQTPMIYNNCRLAERACIQNYNVPKYLAADTINIIYYMASFTSGEMADCDWPRSTFSGHYFPAVICAIT